MTINMKNNFYEVTARVSVSRLLGAIAPLRIRFYIYKFQTHNRS